MYHALNTPFLLLMKVIDLLNNLRWASPHYVIGSLVPLSMEIMRSARLQPLGDSGSSTVREQRPLCNLTSADDLHFMLRARLNPNPDHDSPAVSPAAPCSPRCAFTRQPRCTSWTPI